MRTLHLLAGGALAMTSALAWAQKGPESLLPPGFENPAPAPAPAPAPSRAAPASSPSRTPAPAPAGHATSVAIPVVQPLPAGGGDNGGSNAAATASAADSTGASTDFVRIPSIDELAKMTPEDFEGLLRSHKAYDIPAGARRSLADAGLVDEAEGGIPVGTSATQTPALVRLAMAANRGPMISRWGHIVLRRTLASRLPAPRDMSPQDFLALRVGLLVRMGETDAARAVLQDIDAGDWNGEIDKIALDVYAGTGDLTGVCPAMPTQGAVRNDPPWRVAKSICNAFRGNGAAALQQLDHERYIGSMDRIDLALAQKYAGAAGKSRRAVTLEWGDVNDMTRWRYGLALGTGVEPPADVMAKANHSLEDMTALAPMTSLTSRAAAADWAGAHGVLSSAAMVDLYGQLYADQDITGEWSDRAEQLRRAYVGDDAAARMSAIRALWDQPQDRTAKFGRQVLTAYAAARLAPSEDLSDEAAPLIASMLTAGLDANAMRWAGIVKPGSEGWALLAIAAPRGGMVDTGALDDFISADDSKDQRKAAFLVAGLTGLGRIDPHTAVGYSNKMGLKLAEATRWTSTIDSTASHGDVATTVMLAGLGMQGTSWSQMTPRYLFHIVGALSRAGLRAEARMIAAEAVARA